ncbi:hypothetical protein [Coleofasciculus sp. FACHB-1120]|nr:hypothetical protein [Coleofasciculus sp. FACHB-1120]
MAIVIAIIAIARFPLRGDVAGAFDLLACLPQLTSQLQVQQYQY